MSRTSPRTSIEARGLLRSPSFEIDDLDTIEQYNKQTNRTGDGPFGARRRWKTSSAWLRPRNLLVCLAITVGLIVVGAFWFYQPGNLIKKLKQSDPADSVPTKSILAKPIETTPTETADLTSDEGTADPISVETPNTSLVETTDSASVETPNPTSTGTQSPKVQDSKAHKFDKPKEFKIVGLVFFGRPPVVAILDCYLKKNLVSNGGFLDEVLWAVNTDKPEDLDYLDGLIQTSERYRKVELPEGGYKSIWANAVEDGPMYIKIDDDMVSY